MRQNEALQIAVDQSETDNRTKDLDGDKQLCELKVALADAKTENQTKSVEVKSLSAAVETLTSEIDVSKVVFLSYFVVSN